MKSDIILSGVGGQGILSIAAAIGMAAVESGLNLKQAEVHGMSQRGGAVQSHLRLSDRGISSDLIPFGTADLILSVEPMESLRYLPYLSADGWLVTNSHPYINIPDYPETGTLMEEIRKIPRHVVIDADRIAAELGSSRSSNMVILGAASPYIGLPEDRLVEGIRAVFSRKGAKIADLNTRAFLSGKEQAEKYLGRPSD